jgi:REP element-mobilizing transposase RayT
MPQTHLSLHYHLVFHTKGNKPIIETEWRERLHAFLGGCIKTAGGIPIAVGGTDDHAHLFLGLRATHRLADVVKDVKVASSKWVHTEIGDPRFGWQNGYGAFTVSTSLLERVRKYVLNQEEHHRKRSTRDEYVKLLELAGVEYDERFLW